MSRIGEGTGTMYLNTRKVIAPVFCRKASDNSESDILFSFAFQPSEKTIPSPVDSSIVSLAMARFLEIISMKTKCSLSWVLFLEKKTVLGMLAN